MTRSESGRTLLLVLALAAVGALVFLLLGNPFASDADVGRRGIDGDDIGLADPAGTGDETRMADMRGLQGLYGEGDLGAVKLRLLDVDVRDPIVGQRVRLIARAGALFDAVSGGDGVALIGRLPPGRGYRIEIEGDGFAPVTIQGLEVPNGETADLGDIILGEHVVLRGRVVDGSNRGISKASVSVFTRGGNMLTEGFFFTMVDQATTFPTPVEEVLTDDEGWFSLSSLDDGIYRLEAESGGFATHYEPELLVARKRTARHMTIVLGEGVEVSGTVKNEAGKPVAGARVIAIRDPGRRMMSALTVERAVAVTDGSGKYVIDTLRKGESYRFGVMASGYAPSFGLDSEELRGNLEKNFDLKRGGRMEGVVVKAGDGTPIANADVVVIVGNFMGRRRDGDASTGRTHTDAEGKFSFDGLLPGPASGQIKAPGFVSVTTSAFMGNAWGEIVAGETLTVRVELEQGGAIEGHVVSRDGPIPDATVTVVGQGGQMWRAMMAGSPTTTSGEDGAFFLDGLPPGTYGLIATADGYTPPDPMGDAVRVELAAAGDVAGKDIELFRAARVFGVVTDSAGEPIAGARVRTRYHRDDDAEGGRGRGGRFRDMFRSMLPGGSQIDLTDENGRFSLAGVSTEGRWTLFAEASDYVPAETEPFAVDPGEEREVNVLMSGGGALSGRVVDERGQFVPGATVQVGHLEAAYAGRARLTGWEMDGLLDPRKHTTDEDGRFVVSDLPPGITLVKVEKEGYVTFYKRNAVVRPDETTENYMVALVRGDTLEGKVLGADGRPLAGAFVVVTSNPNPGSDEEEEMTETSEDVEPSMNARTDQDGTFRVENIPPGMYTVAVGGAPGHKSWFRDRDDTAIRRGIASSATNVEFRLVVSEGGGGFRGGGGR